MSEIDLRRFIVQSNMIEGINREPTDAESDAHKAFLSVATVMVCDVEGLVAVLATAPLRREVGMDVYVGNHRPPPGGPNIEMELEYILRQMSTKSPWVVHLAYETLHPFMDGNGRSGRALWLWMMGVRGLPTLGFLHAFYYQTLSESRK